MTIVMREIQFIQLKGQDKVYNLHRLRLITQSWLIVLE